MKCPGQDIRYWKPGDIFEMPCPKCGALVEFFKDEPTRRCKECGHKFVNPRMDFGCAAYCKFAEQCLGELPAELLAKRKDLLKDQVALAMKRTFGQDFRRIGHASRVARYAQRIASEIGADPAVVLCAAYLHDIGIPNAERKHGSTAARFQEEEGPPLARDILEGLGADPSLVDEVSDIVGHHHHPRAEETLNFQAVYDADRIVNLEESLKEQSAPSKSLEAQIAKGFLTEAGRTLARKVLLDQGGEET